MQETQKIWIVKHRSNWTNAIETSLSDHHKPIYTFLKSCFERLKPKIVYYRNYEKFNEANFLNDVKTATSVWRPTTQMKTTTFYPTPSLTS